MKYLLIFLFPLSALAQPSAFAIDYQWVEAMPFAGFVVPNHAGFPAVGPQFGGQLSYGRRQFSKPWAAYYNYPSVGLAASYQELGNSEVFGSAVSLFPFIELHTAGSEKKDWLFRFSLGATRFSTFYDVDENIGNIVVGSRYTWAFHAYLGKNILTGRRVLLRATAGFLHGSNGHVQLPNFGINSGVIGLAARFRSGIPFSVPPRVRRAGQRVSQVFATVASGAGLQELGGTVGPVGGDKQGVYFVSAGIGMLWRRHIQVRTGFTYRRYGQYEQYIKEIGPEAYRSSPGRYASSVHYFLACEFLMGHFGIDIEGGLTLHKPFYRTFVDEYEPTTDFKFWLKQLFPTRLGLKAYAMNTSSTPKWNAFVAAHINANFGEADFSSLSFGYIKYFGER